ncbi:MAG TPA: amidohydrolase family protein [Stellaceae bacterium]|nr:amidohydrolase family protein [Stellaceae bacterium]
MKRIFGGMVLLGLLLLTPSAFAQSLVLNGVTVVDTQSGKLTRNQSVAIDNGKITQIARAGTIKAGAGTKAVDARGKYLVPVYLDMHVHSFNAPDPTASLELMLANGITGVRQMSGSPELLAARRDDKLILPKDGPELLAMPGTVLTGANAGTPEAAVAEVDRQKQQGADFIKVIDVKPDPFFAALAESKKLGLVFDGHLQATSAIEKAADEGMSAIEHLGPRESVLIGCSSDEDALRKVIAEKPPQAPPSASGPGPADRALRATTNPIMSTDPVSFDLMKRVVATYSDSKCRDLTRRIKKDGMWMTPTLIRLRTMEFGDDPAYRHSPNLRYVPAKTQQLWQQMAVQFPTIVTPDRRAMLKKFWGLQLRLTKLLDDSGVPMMAGTDAGGAGHWEISGISLHQEFDLLHQAGLKPLTILQMTTINGAKFLHREERMGTVAVGKDANLVLLDANPVASEANLHRIKAVVRSGTYYDKGALEKLKQDAEKRVAG